MHVHARSEGEQRRVIQSGVEQSTASLDSFFECHFDKKYSEKPVGEQCGKKGSMQDSNLEMEAPGAPSAHIMELSPGRPFSWIRGGGGGADTNRVKAHSVFGPGLGNTF